MKRKKNTRKPADATQVDLKVLELSKHEYDIDLIDLFRSLERLTQTSSKLLKPRFDRDRYLLHLRGLIEHYCNDKGVDFDYAFRHRHLLIFPSDNLYPLGLALEIVTRDFHKLKAFLAAQQVMYTDAPGFLNLLEFRVYDLLNLHSLLADNSKRQAFLMKWVEGQRKSLQMNSWVFYEPQDQSPLGTESEAESQNNKGKRPPKPRPIKTIKDIFISKDKFELVLHLLKSEGLISEEEQWIGQTSKKTEILLLLSILTEKGYIKPGPKTTKARCFCKHFGVELEDRTYRFEAKSMDEQSKYFDQIIPSITPSKKDTVADKV